ncbi:protein DBF4 homolog A [Rhinophrynus dorsalis]
MASWERTVLIAAKVWVLTAHHPVLLPDNTFEIKKGAESHGRGVKMKPVQSTVKKQSTKVPSTICKPLAGKVFYLDLTSKLVSEKLEKDIKELGGAVEGFLSKEISYLITSKKEAKCMKTLKYISSIPSPESPQNTGECSTRPSNRNGCQEGSPCEKPEKGLVSRGKSLVKKAIKEQEILPKNSILSNALNWGVKILHVDEAKRYIEQKKCLLQREKKTQTSVKAVVKRPSRQKVKPQKLKSPFIKVEDNSCQYRPLYLVLPLFRSFQNPTSKPHISVDKKVNAGPKLPETKQSKNKPCNGQETGNNVNTKLKEQKKQGYCECCLKKYDDLESHVLSQQHMSYAEGSHYQDVDNLISAFDFDFVDWSKYKNGQKSVGILMLAERNRQEEQEINQANKFSLQKNSSEKKPTMKTNNLQDKHVAVCTPSHSAVCNIEPMCYLPSPNESVCTKKCSDSITMQQHVTNSMTPLSLKTGFPASIGDVEMLSIINNKINQSEGGENQIQGLNVELEPCKSPKNHQKCVSEPAGSFLNQTFNPNMVDDISVRTASHLRPMVNTEQNGTLEKTCPSMQSDESISHMSDCETSGKPHRKVKTLRKNRSKDELYCRFAQKVSVPQDEEDFSLPNESLLALFASSDENKEFVGFTNSSLYNADCVEEDQEVNQENMLWSLFSHTTTSASSFIGF